MRSSKLGQLLHTFDETDWKRFEAFLHSPYFNKNEAVTQLGSSLAASAPELPEGKEAAFQAAFPGQAFDARKMGHLMNYLLKLAEQFLAVQRLEQEAFQQQRYTLIELSERKLGKHYDFLLKKTKESVSDALQATEVLRRQYELSEVEMVHFSHQKVRRFDPSMQAVYEELNEYYYAQVLKYACALLSWQLVVSGHFKLSPITEQLIQQLSEHPPVSPLTRLYLSIYKTLSTGEEESGAHFQLLLQFLQQYRGEIAINEMQEIYLYAINFCARKMRKGEKGYAQLVLQLYEEAIANRYLFDNGYLSHWTYTNVVKLGLLQTRYDWTEQFIHKYKEDLPPRFYEDAFHFNLAELYFYRGNYSEVLNHLQHLSFSDPYYNLGSRMILIKTFYELDETEALLSHLASFTIFLKRNRGLSSAYQQTCLNFCKLLHQILRTTSAEKQADLLERTEHMQPLAERNWLLKTLSEKLAKH